MSGSVGQSGKTRPPTSRPFKGRRAPARWKRRSSSPAVVAGPTVRPSPVPSVASPAGVASSHAAGSPTTQ
ncbi:hypothetical protein [Nonomuraea africana]|uniref:Uncharacterized protein n=1 Tax=Nonomuraea africana TaxID=46171 RepID=A0ABR9KK02_9ACTN|nr:hypothetical protein [Nonomuraea africana]MBE1561867.1 hypothetical protein [Nonomuraea africana]